MSDCQREVWIGILLAQCCGCLLQGLLLIPADYPPDDPEARSKADKAYEEAELKWREKGDSSVLCPLFADGDADDTDDKEHKD